MTRRTLSLALSGAIACGAVAGAYSSMGPRWMSQQIPYSINPANSGLSEDDTIAALQAGAMSWTGQSGASVVPYFDGKSDVTTIARNGRSEVFFRKTTGNSSYGQTYTWYDSNNRMIEADTIFYAGGVKFASDASGCTGSAVYLQDAMTHEFGHALGLGHSDVASATMNRTMGWCSKDARYLDPADLAGLEALYPAMASAPAQAVAPVAPRTTARTAPVVAGSSPLVAKAYMVKNQPRTDLTWKGLTGPKVDIYRNGVKATIVNNLGMYTDATPAAGVNAYIVCVAGSSTCSAAANVSF